MLHVKRVDVYSLMIQNLYWLMKFQCDYTIVALYMLVITQTTRLPYGKFPC